MINRPFRFQVYLLVLTQLVGCRDDEDIPAYRKFTEEPPAEVDARFLLLSPTEQVAVYVVGISRFRPSDTRFASLLSAEGDRVLPVLVEELNAQRCGVFPKSWCLSST